MTKPRSTKNLSHVDDRNLPAMVDVGAKKPTARQATASARIWMPEAVWVKLQDDDIQSPKGPVVQTAIIAGTMATRKTPDLIPFCHPIPVEGCRFAFSWQKPFLEMRCTVKTHAKTGVEMEALTGVNIAALTVYDMCKALSHQLRIEMVQLCEKRGGKSDITKAEQS